MSLVSRVRRWFSKAPAAEQADLGFGVVPDPGLANNNWFRQWVGIYQLVDRMARARGGNLVERPIDERMLYIARGLMRYNTYAQGIIANLRSYTLGANGLVHTPTGPSAGKLKPWLEGWKKEADWWSREREIYERVHVEGEAFTRFFPGDGTVELRPIEPEWVLAPDGSLEWTFGVYNEPDDVELQTAVNILLGNGRKEVVDWNEYYHIKSKLSVRADKRGRSDFLASAAILDDSFKTWRNFAQSEAVRQAITWFAKQAPGVTSEDLDQAIAAESDYRPPSSDGRRGGSPIQLTFGSGIEYLQEGTELLAAPAANAQGTMTGVNAAMLAAGRAYSMPLVLLTGDMSANNTLDFGDEAPFSTAISDEQNWYCRHVRNLLWRVVEAAVDEGLLPGEVLTDGTDIAVTAERKPARNMSDNTQRAKTLYDDGVISGRTRATLEGVKYDEEQAERKKEGLAPPGQQQAPAEPTLEDVQVVTVHRGGKTFQQHRKKGKAKPDVSDVPKALQEKTHSVAQRVMQKVRELAVKLSPAAHKVGAALAEIFDVPADMKKFAYNPTSSGHLATNDFVAASMNNAFGMGVSGHIVAAVAAHVLSRVVLYAKKKLAQEDTTPGLAEFAEFLAEVYRAIIAETGKGEAPQAADIEANLREVLRGH